MIKLFEMFAGYGGASFALKKAGIEFECIGYSEIDKYAIQCYEQNHKGKNYGDCSKIDTSELPNFDLLTGGFPCQDVSIAGKRDLNKGRTNLYKEILRIAKDKKPKYMLLENVKGLLSINKERNLRDIIINDLRKIGYDVVFGLLNSKDYGIPQNRERVWFVCKLGKWNFGEFQFPNKEELNIFLKDILEENVNEKYYLSKKMIKNILTPAKVKWNSGKMEINLNIARTLTKTMHKMHRADTDNYVSDDILQINNPKHSNDRIYSDKGVSPTLNTMQGGNRQPFIKKNTAIRKLTPKECFRLMGFLNDEINLEGLSDTQKYKLAGNGWDINLVSKIFKRLF